MEQAIYTEAITEEVTTEEVTTETSDILENMSKDRRRTLEVTTRVETAKSVASFVPSEWLRIGNTEWAIALENGMVATLKMTLKVNGFTGENYGKTVEDMANEYVGKVERALASESIKPEIQAIRAKAEAEIEELRVASGIK